MKSFFKDEISDFISYLTEVRGYSPLTAKTYFENLKEAFSYIDISREDDVWEWNLTPYRTYLKEKNKKTISKKVSIVRSFAKYLEEVGYNIFLVADDSIKVPKTLPKPISFRHIKEALEKAKDDERVVIVLIYGLGLRISEASNLKLKDISKEWIRVEGKGKKTREIPLLPLVRKEIENYLANNPSTEYLFEKNKKRVCESALRYKIEKAFKRVGIKATPHQLRHSFATDILNEGGRITDVSRLLGHSSLGTTEIYTKLNNKRKLESYMKSHPMAKDMDESF